MPSSPKPKRDLSPPLLPQYSPPAPSTHLPGGSRIFLPAVHRLSLASQLAASARAWRAYLWPGDATPLLLLLTFILWGLVLIVTTGLNMGKDAALGWVWGMLKARRVGA